MAGLFHWHLFPPTESQPFELLKVIGVLQFLNQRPCVRLGVFYVSFMVSSTCITYKCLKPDLPWQIDQEDDVGWLARATWRGRDNTTELYTSDDSNLRFTKTLQ